MPNPNATNPKTGLRYGFEEEQRRKKAEDPKVIQQQIALLKRQQRALEARERFMPFIKFTMPDPEDPNDVERSIYENARHHDAIARVMEEVEKGAIQFLILTTAPRHGKEIADSEPVLTPDGWRRHGDLRPGDHVYGPDGVPVRVVAIAEPNQEKVRVTFTNGDNVLCHPNHEWVVRTKGGAWRAVETRALMAMNLRRGPPGRGGRYTVQIPDVRGVCFAERHLPMDPYSLGVWLGDGATGCGRIDMAAEDRAVWQRMTAAGWPVSSELPHPETGVIRVHFGVKKPGTRGPFTEALHKAGVLDAKHIPEAYLRSSRAQRMELLAGLMDTDGHVEAATGRCRIVTTNAALRDGVVDLCTTLGFRPYVTQQAPALSSSGIQGRSTVFTVGFQPYEEIPVSLARRRVVKFAARRSVSITSIDPAPDEAGRCIQVDRADGLYLVGRTLLPTHNSEIVSRRFPAWFVGRHPEQNVVVATYNDDFAMDFGKDVRGIMSLPQYKQVFPEVRLAKGGAASNRLQTTKGGLLTFVGRGGSLTGRGAHCLVIDDIISNFEQANSQTIRDQTWDWFTKVAMTRRMGKKLVVITFTRWHNDDVIGRLTDPENQHYNEALARKIKIINLPAIAGDDDPLGRAPGDVLWPSKYDAEFLEEQRALDPLGFEALYQQRPSLLDGDLFKRENIRFYDRPPENLRYYAASDHAVGTGQRNDPSCFLKIGVDENDDIYLIDAVWKKMPTDQAVEAMLAMCRGKTAPLRWWAERGHISKSIGPFLRKRMLETGTYINIAEVTPVADKAQRAQSIAARVAMGKVYLPKNAPWLEKAINEMMAFPNGTHDDFVDALAYIGLGLQSQFRPGKNRQEEKAKDAPKFGTMAWVKQADKWAEEQRARTAAGGF